MEENSYLMPVVYSLSLERDSPKDSQEAVVYVTNFPIAHTLWVKGIFYSVSSQDNAPSCVAFGC